MWFHLVTPLLKNQIVTIIIKVIKFSFSKCHKFFSRLTWFFPCIASLGYLQRGKFCYLFCNNAFFFTLLCSFFVGRWNGRPPNIATFPENLFQLLGCVLAKPSGKSFVFLFVFYKSHSNYVLLAVLVQENFPKEIIYQWWLSPLEAVS